MVRVTGILVVVMVLPGPLLAQDGDVREAEPLPADTHTVERSETLEALARDYYGDPDAWELIFEANRHQIDDPDRIREGQRLVIPALDEGDRAAASEPEVATDEGDEPALVREIRAEPEVAAREDEAGSGSMDPEVDRRRAHRTRDFEPISSGSFPEDGVRTVFYYQDTDHRPEPELVMADQEDWSEVPAGAWLGAPWLTTEGDHPDRLGYVADFAGGGEHQAAGREAIHLHDRLRVALAPQEDVEVGDELLAYRVEPVSVTTVLQAGVAESEDDVEEATQIRPTGVLEVERIDDGGVVARVTREFRAMSVLDAVASYREEASEPGVHPTSVSAEEALVGELVGFEEARPLVHRGARGYIDLGAVDGVRVGDVFVALGGGDEAGGWGTQEVARLQVIRAEEETSVVRVDEVHAAVRDGGLPVRRVRRMP